MPMLHAYAHEKICQLLFGPKLLLGAGQEDGEVIERVWKNCTNSSLSTQRETFENREDSLSLMVEALAQTKLCDFITIISKKLKNIWKEINLVRKSVADDYKFKTYEDVVSSNIKVRHFFLCGYHIVSDIKTVAKRSLSRAPRE